MKKEIRFLTDVPDIKKEALIKFFADKNHPLTHLSQFIYEKGFSYEEPQRIGTSKGDPIGFSKNKYLASLYMLTNYKKKDIAKELKISYGLLRKWGTEKEFKEMVMSHYTEFISILSVYIFKIIAFKYIANEELIKKAVHELIKTDLTEFSSQKCVEYDTGFDKLSDAKDYNDRLVNLFFMYLIDYIEKTLPQIADDALMFQFKLAAYSVIHYIEQCKGILSEEMKQHEVHIINRLHNAMVDNVINILGKTKITEKDRKQAIIALQMLKQKV